MEAPDGGLRPALGVRTAQGPRHAGAGLCGYGYSRKARAGVHIHCWQSRRPSRDALSTASFLQLSPAYISTACAPACISAVGRCRWPQLVMPLP